MTCHRPNKDALWLSISVQGQAILVNTRRSQFVKQCCFCLSHSWLADLFWFMQLFANHHERKGMLGWICLGFGGCQQAERIAFRVF
jgi:hypothetical protein